MIISDQVGDFLKEGINMIIMTSGHWNL